MDKGEYEDVLVELLQDEEGVVSLDTCVLCGSTFARGRFTCGMCEREVCQDCLAQPPRPDWAVCRVCGGHTATMAPHRRGSGPSVQDSASDREPVVSSHLRSVGYDEDRRVLSVEFHSGSVYEYFGVPGAEHRALMQADSKGRHFNLHIRRSYRCTRVE